MILIQVLKVQFIILVDSSWYSFSLRVVEDDSEALEDSEAVDKLSEISSLSFSFTVMEDSEKVEQLS